MSRQGPGVGAPRMWMLRPPEPQLQQASGRASLVIPAAVLLAFVALLLAAPPVAGHAGALPAGPAGALPAGPAGAVAAAGPAAEAVAASAAEAVREPVPEPAAAESDAEQPTPLTPPREPDPSGDVAESDATDPATGPPPPGEPGPGPNGEDGEDVEAEPVPDTPAPAPPRSAPAVRTSPIPTGTIVLASLVLLVGTGLLVRVTRRERAAGDPDHRAASLTDPAGAPDPPLHAGQDPPPVAPQGQAMPPVAPQGQDPPPVAPQGQAAPPGAAAMPPPPPPAPQASPAIEAETLALLLELGSALIDAGDAVGHVQEVLLGVAAVNGAEDVAVVVLPTALIVSLPDGETVETKVIPAGRQHLRLDQVGEVARIAAAAGRGTMTLSAARTALAAVRRQPPRLSAEVRLVGYVLLTVGLAMILRGRLTEVLVAAGLGAVVGWLQLRSPWREREAFGVLLPVLAAAAAAGVVFGLGRVLPELAVFPPLVAPLVALLPGALLTTAVFELATGHVISGSGRLAAGMLRLVMLALGILAAAQLLGVPAAEVSAAATGAAGIVGPWIGIAVFGVGVVVFHSVQREFLPGMLVVLYLAYAGQVLGGLFFGSTLSAFFGAIVMTPVAIVVSRRPVGPPALVSFLPGFWLLVPGALGLAGITSFLTEDRVQGIASLITMGTSMIGISLGVLLGLLVGRSLSSWLAVDGRA